MDYNDLVANGYKVENAKITSVDLSMEDHGCLTLSIGLNGRYWTCVYGGYSLGRGYLGAKTFKGSPKGIEYLMRIMDIVGVSSLNSLVGKYIRVATNSLSSPIKIIGNIIEDKWFDAEEFFRD